MHAGVFHRQWIAAQGPIDGPNGGTCAAFWQSVWESETNLVLMLTRLYENSHAKCAKYWPDDSMSEFYGNLIVESMGEINHGAYVERTLRLTHQRSKKKRDGKLIRIVFESRLFEILVTQLQYVKWPDHGIPDDPSDFLKFVSHFRTTLDDSFGSCLVHCSAGVGRTGVTIAVDTCIALISQNIPVNPLESVLLKTAIHSNEFLCNFVL